MTNEDLNAIRQIMREEISNQLDPVNKRLDRIDEQLQDIDNVIGMIANWADTVGVITRVPFAAGQK